MSTLHLRDPVNLGPSVSKLALLAIEIDVASKRVFLRYTPPGDDGVAQRGHHEQMEILTDAPMPREPDEDPDKDADAKAREIYRAALADAKAKQFYTDFLTDKRPVLERAHDFFVRLRGIKRA